MPKDEVEATAAAEELAAAEGVDLSDVEGTGAEGRVTKADVELAAAGSEEGASSEASGTSDAEAQVAEEMSGSALSEALEADTGFIGQEVDPTPNENYTVAGVVAGEPTPETDEGAYDDAKKRRREVREFMTPEGTSLGRQAD